MFFQGYRLGWTKLGRNRLDRPVGWVFSRVVESLAWRLNESPDRPTGEGNETFLIRVWKSLSIRCILKPWGWRRYVTSQSEQYLLSSLFSRLHFFYFLLHVFYFPFSSPPHFLFSFPELKKQTDGLTMWSICWHPQLFHNRLRNFQKPTPTNRKMPLPVSCWSNQLYALYYVNLWNSLFTVCSNLYKL